MSCSDGEPRTRSTHLSAETLIHCRGCGYCLRGLGAGPCPECGRAFDPSNPTTTDRCPWRRHLRRASKVLASIILVPTLALGSAVSYVYWGWRSEQPTVVAARRDGRGCSFAPIGPEWLQRRAGRYAYLLRRVRSLYVAGPDAAAQMADLPRLKYLDRLTLVRPTDETMAGLSGARGIRELWVLAYGNLTDSGVSHIRGLPRLRQLNVHFTPAAGPKADAMGSMPSVYFLSLVHTRTDDASLGELRGLNNVRILNLAETAVTDAGLHELAALGGLESVDLTDTGVTETGLAELKRCRHLRYLRISFVPGEDGIASLKQFPALRFLTSTSSRRGPGLDYVTRADFEHLRRELPHVTCSPPPW